MSSIILFIFILTVFVNSSSQTLSKSDKAFLVISLRVNGMNLTALLNCPIEPFDRNCVQRKLFPRIDVSDVIYHPSVKAFIFLY